MYFKTILVCLILTAGFAITESIPDTPINVTVQNTEGARGSSVSVPIIVGNTTGSGIGSVNFTLDYNYNILTATGISTDGTLASDWTTYPYIYTGQIVVSMFSSGVLNGAGTLVKVNFTVSPSASGTSPLTLSEFIFNDGSIPVNITNGIFTVASAGIMLTDPNGGNNIKGGSIYNILWTGAGTGTHHIHLQYSTNSGGSYQDITASTANDGVYEWNVPMLNLSSVRVKAIAEDSSNVELSSDTSNSDFTIDSTAPVTNITLNGTQGEGGWWVTNVQVTLAGTDNLSGMKETRYRVNSGEWSVYIAPFLVTGSTVEYYSTDNAGNTETVKTSQVSIDKTPPGAPAVTDDGECTANGSQLHAIWTASTDPESGVVLYHYAIGRMWGGYDVVDWTSAGTSTQVTRTGLSLTVGQTYYISVKAKNGAGWWSDIGSSNGIIYQMLQIVVTPANLTFYALAGGANPASQKLYISRTGCGTLDWSVSKDANWLSCAPTNGSCADETDEVTVSANITGLTPGTYYADITVSAPTASNTPRIIPVTLNITETSAITIATPNGGDIIKGGSIYSIMWTGAGSGTHHIHLQYSTNSGGSFQDIAASTANDGVYEWNVPALNSSSVRVKAIAENSSNVELSSDTSNSDFTIDSAVPVTNITLNGLQGEGGWFVADVQVILTGTDNLSGMKETRYRVNSGEWSVYIMPFLVTGSTVEYYSTDNAGNTETVKTSQVSIDKTPPGAPAVTDDGECTANGSQLHATWTAVTDPESGVVLYQYAIGRMWGGYDVVDWTSAGTSTQVTRTGLSLTVGQTYYISVKAKNGAGWWSDIGSSNGIIYQLPQLVVTPANLTFYALAGGANPASQKLYISRTGCGTLDWSVSKNAGWLSCAPTNGSCTDETDEVTVSAIITGLTSGVYQANITVDADAASNAPRVVPVTLNITETSSIILLAPNGGDKIKGGGIYNISWAGTEPSTHHIHLQYSTNSGGSFQDITASTENDGVYGWNVPALNSSSVRVKAIAENSSNVELSSDTSNSDFTIDSIAPVTNITLNGTQGEGGWFVTDVQVTLTGTDNLSGVKETRYRVNNGEWSVYIAPFLVTGSTVEYYSTDNAGNTETVKTSQVNIDKTPPDVPAVTDDGECTANGSQLHAVWTAVTDSESGVVLYQYAIGTTPGSNSLLDWTPFGTNTEVIRTGLSLVAGQVYYISVKAKNGAGWWSDIGSSNGIIYQLPQIGVTPASLTFYALAGGANPVPQKLIIINPGCGILNWSVGKDASWLSCAPATGSCTDEADEVTVSVNIAGLGTTTHHANIIVSAVGASNTPQVIPVTLNIYAGNIPVVLLNPDGGEKIRGNSIYNINWTGAIGAHHIHLLYSTDSGLSYQNVVTSTENDGVYEWNPVPLLNSIQLRVKVIAENSNNIELSSDASNGDFTIDSIAPVSTIHLTGTQGENGWWTSNVQVTLTATDNLTGVDKITYKIDVEQWQTYTGPFMVTGSNLSYRSEDRAGNLEAAKLQEIKIDTTRPSLPVVTDDGAYTYSKTQLHASWTCSDEESGIAFYEYGIGNTPGSTNVVDWTSAGTNTEVTATGLNLTGNQTYYFRVRAKNNAGLWSYMGGSDGITVVVMENQEIHLYPGWNLISVSLDIENTSLLSVLGQINGLYTAVYAYDAASGSWKRYIPGGPDNSLNIIEPGKGYSIYMTSAAVLTITGRRITSTAVQLLQGWNLAGYNSITSKLRQDALTSIQGKYIYVYTYDSQTKSWLKYIVYAPGAFNNLTWFTPNKGYWIYVSANCTWNVSQ